MTNLDIAPNPFFEDDEDDYPEPHFDSEPMTGHSRARASHANPYAPVRSVAEQEEVDRRKASGEVPDGRKKNVPNPVYRRRTLTQKDMNLLVPLAKFQFATADLLRPLQVIQNPDNARLHRFVKSDTVTHRLRGLEEAGLVRSHSIVGTDTLWAATDKGHAAADLAYQFRTAEAHPLTKFNPSEAAHQLGAVQIAMQAMSPTIFDWQRKLRVPTLTYDQILSEHEIRHHWAVRRNLLEEEGKDLPDDMTPKNFGAWRERDLMSMIRQDAAESDFEWKDITRWYPELWTIGSNEYGTKRYDVRNHHHPDLVFNLEEQRKGRSPVSVAVEVELNPKDASTYRKHLATWNFCELAPERKGTMRDGAEVQVQPPRWQTSPTVYKQLVYFTNSKEAVRNLRLADKGFGLEDAGKLVILPLLNNDNKTPMKLARSWARN
ncbi:hypothetical protein KZI27_14130 [Curtobacterium sp. TC1]|uniref:hypothetical protein n=1 Tax=Curtobacterium sp. TC1 TaxID=2862880 RepID=UPI001C9A69CB|nr:hypothetical protein [Curtobacterium sp. TC1]QZQ54440.1 hypothetical protein KZI27_14130 [Curtobacterium sp. TC1]